MSPAEGSLDEDEHVFVDLFGLLGVECVLAIRLKALKCSYEACEEAIGSSEVDANEWLNRFMIQNIGKSLQTLVEEQPVLEILCALSVRVHRGLKYKIVGSGKMERCHEGTMFVCPYLDQPECV